MGGKFPFTGLAFPWHCISYVFPVGRGEVTVISLHSIPATLVYKQLLAVSPHWLKEQIPP
jgi:hypothetical protein